MNKTKKNTAKTVAKIIKDIRSKLKITQCELATKLGVSQGTLSKYENELLIPSVHEWFGLCQLYRDNHEDICSIIRDDSDQY